MRGTGRDIRNLHGARIKTDRNQARHVGHIGHKVGGDTVGDVPEPLPVESQAIRREPRYDHFGLVLFGEPFHLVIVDLAGIRIETILHGVIEFSREVDGGTVREVSAVRETHSEHRIPGIQQSHIYGRVRTGSRMRLHVDVIGAKQFLGPVNGQLLGDIDKFTTAVVALAGIPFSILVG